jgi:hypothetical protein
MGGAVGTNVESKCAGSANMEGTCAASGADMISTDRPYLYDQQDFDAWLKDLSE